MMIPLSIPCLQGNEKKYLNECLDSGWVSSAGPWVNRFEKEFASYLGVSDAVSLTSGTAALHLALLLSDVKPGDEVLVPTLTFIAPVNTIRYIGAHPVFMDCDDYLNLDTQKVAEFLEKECIPGTDGKPINRKSGRRVSAIIPVHIFGHPCDLRSLREISDQHGIRMIEDATESLGSSVGSNGNDLVRTGTVGHFGCFSFNGNKIITTGGGGMLVGQNLDTLKKARYLSTQAKDDEIFFEHGEVGYNYRLTSIQAALGIAQLEQIDGFVKRKRLFHKLYRELFSDSSWAHIIGEPPGTYSNCWLTTLEFKGDRRVNLRKFVEVLQLRGIQTRPVWKLNHQQRPFLDYQGYRLDNAERLYPRLLSLPSSSHLTEKEIEEVAIQVKSLYEETATH